MQDVLNFIDGRHAPAASGEWLDDVDPATGEAYARVASSDGTDVDRAVAAAVRAFGSWSTTPASERSKLLRQLARLIERDLEELARAESIDSGKPLAVARSVDVPRAVQNFDFFADAVTQFSSEAHPTDEVALNYTLRQPLGAVACISPWNLPLYLLTWKIAPALAAGNCVVAKPCLCGSRILIEKPIYAQVRDALVERVRALRVGGEIARESAASFKKLSLEMGGKNPTLIFADADLREAVPQALRAAFSNSGQICLCGSRILIEKPIYAQVRDALVERVRALRVGDPLEPATEQGALVSRQHFDKVMGCLAVARGEGARVLCGGERASVKGRCAGGFFVQPTLLEGLGPGCRTNQEEIFGPVATLLPFEGTEEAVQLANSTRYGLAASLWTRDLSRAHKVAARLQSGIVWVNCWMLRDLRTPFGGVKESGLGREGGVDALRFFTEPKNVCVKL